MTKEKFATFVIISILFVSASSEYALAVRDQVCSDPKDNTRYCVVITDEGDVSGWNCTKVNGAWKCVPANATPPSPGLRDAITKAQAGHPTQAGVATGNNTGTPLLGGILKFHPTITNATGNNTGAMQQNNPTFPSDTNSTRNITSSSNGTGLLLANNGTHGTRNSTNGSNPILVDNATANQPIKHHHKPKPIDGNQSKAGELGNSSFTS